MRKLAILAVVAACGGSSAKPPPSTGPANVTLDCDVLPTAVDRMMTRANDDPRMKELTPEAREMARDMAAKMAPKMKEILVASCREDGWSTAYLECVDRALTQPDLERCASLLTADQTSEFERRIVLALGIKNCTVISSTIDRMMEAAKNDPRIKAMPPEAQKMAEEMAARMAPKIKQATEEACREDRWSAEVLACFDAGKTQADMKTCQGMLTPEQRTRVENKVYDAMGMSRPPQPSPSPSPAPSP